MRCWPSRSEGRDCTAVKGRAVRAIGSCLHDPLVGFAHASPCEAGPRRLRRGTHDLSLGITLVSGGVYG